MKTKDFMIPLQKYLNPYNTFKEKAGLLSTIIPVDGPAS